MTTTENWIEVGSVTWFYRDAKPVNETTKPPVVLLHGLPSQSYGWREVMEALADQGFWAIAPDWPGFGFSDKPDKRDFAYTSVAFQTALDAWMQAMNLERVHLVVQGFLGSVGLQYALQHRDRIERLAILNAPITPEAKVPWKIGMLGIPLVGDMLTQDPLLVDRTLEGGGQYRVSDEDLDVYRRPFLKSSDAGRSLLATVQNLRLSEATAQISDGFKSWDAPIQVQWGVNDPWLSIDQAQAFVKQTPAAELVSLEEVGHYPQQDWPEKVANALIPFLRRSA
ncbi:MAG: alpha/beta fold hydrolase [Synechococcales cyanobacterium K44_A2020_017]|nr:alpha/beta fold hydrolase [Synechococcales cyanobacterium K32_A2020_035]MBF2096608.1 alpha/beta fold hydrolase [Synechococcales cyanobacterium K44_A2020_017]